MINDINNRIIEALDTLKLFEDIEHNSVILERNDKMKKFNEEATLTDFKPYLSINSHEDKENQEKIDKVKNQFDKIKS